MAEPNSQTFRAPWVVVLSFLLLLGAIGIGVTYNLAGEGQKKIEVLQKEKVDRTEIDREHGKFDSRLEKIEKKQDDLKDFLIEKLGKPK